MERADRQSHAAALRFGGEEGIEDLVPLFRPAIRLPVSLTEIST